MTITCGMFIITKPSNKILICHPTNGPGHKNWSIPKGLKDNFENPLECAIRETFEETGIKLGNVFKYPLVGESVYSSGNKKLIAFKCEIEDSISQNFVLDCYTTFDQSENPEIDMYKWASVEECSRMLHEAQIRLLKLLNI